MPRKDKGSAANKSKSKSTVNNARQTLLTSYYNKTYPIINSMIYILYKK